MYKKICAQCGKEFESESWSVICCSLECYRQRQKEQERSRRAQKKSISQLKDFTLEQQSQRIAELEAQLAEKSDNPSAGELADLKNKNIELLTDLARLAKENAELKNRCADLEERLKDKPNKSAKNKSGKEDRAMDLQYCDRMKISAAKLPCGERSYCWGNNKCEKNPLKEKPSDLLLDKDDKGFKA